MGPRVNGSLGPQTTAPDTTAPPVGTTAPAAKQEPVKAKEQQQEPKTAKKNEEGSKQHAAENKSSHQVRGQAMQKSLADKLPPKEQKQEKAPVMDQKYYEKLADMPKEDLEKYYRANPEMRTKLRENYNKINSDKLDPATRTKLEGLGDNLQRLQNEKWSQKAVQKYEGKSSTEIAKGYLDQVDTQFAGNRPDRIKDIALDLRDLAASEDPKAKASYDKAFEAFKGSMQHVRQNGSPSVPKEEVISELEKLSGPGAAKVKADMIKYMVDTKPGAKPKEVEVKGIGTYSVQGEDKNPQYPGVYVARLLKSDASGITNHLEYMADRNPKENGRLMDRSLQMVARAYAKDPDKAADTLGTLLGSATKDYINVIKEVPPDHAKIADYGQRVGHMQRSAENMAGYIAKEAKTKLDNGAFIANVFTKGVEIVATGGMSEVDAKKVTKFKDEANGFIESARKKEYKQVDDWQAGIKQTYSDIIGTAYFANEPTSGAESRESREFMENKAVFEAHINAGYDDHVKEESEYRKRGRLP